MRCLLEEEYANDRYRDYVAVVQTNIARLLCSYLGGEWKLPNYVEYMYPGRVPQGPQTAEEIREYILKRLAS